MAIIGNIPYFQTNPNGRKFQETASEIFRFTQIILWMEEVLRQNPRTPLFNVVSGKPSGGARFSPLNFFFFSIVATLQCQTGNEGFSHQGLKVVYDSFHPPFGHMFFFFCPKHTACRLVLLSQVLAACLLLKIAIEA